MINQKYFQEDFLTQLRRLGDSAAAAYIVLRNGTEYAISQIRSAEPNYLFATIYPRECMPDAKGIEDAFKALNDPEGKVAQDEIAIGYEDISHVIITRKVPGPDKKMGFIQ